MEMETCFTFMNHKYVHKYVPPVLSCSMNVWRSLCKEVTLIVSTFSTLSINPLKLVSNVLEIFHSQCSLEYHLTECNRILLHSCYALPASL